jgi:tetratricopeptide (TPR) repeat protein
MTRLLALLLTALFIVGPRPVHAESWPDLSTPPQGGGGGAADAALLVGIGTYDVLDPIHGVDRNVADWYQWLTRARGVPVGSVKVIRDRAATKEELVKAASATAGRVKPGGTLWFVFVGHGAPSQDAQDGVLVGADARQTTASLYARSVSRAELLALLEAGQQDHTVVVLDACFSGKTDTGEDLVDDGSMPSLVSGSWKPKRSLVLSAARSDEFAGPLPGEARPAFSYLLLGALRGWGDEDGDGQVTAREALDYTNDALFTLPTGRTQTPELRGIGEGLVLGSGLERGPDLSAFVMGSEQGPGPGVIGPVVIGRSGGADELADQLAKLELASRQRDAAEAAAAAAAQQERELLAALKARQQEELDAAEAALLREASQTWTRVSALASTGGPEAVEAVQLFLGKYGEAKVWVEDQRTGRTERAVHPPAVDQARAWLTQHRSPAVEALAPPSVELSRAKQLEAAGKPREALAGYELLVSVPSAPVPARAEAAYRIGAIHYGDEDALTASAWFERALAIGHPDVSKRALYMLGALRAQAQDWAGATEAFTELERRFPSDSYADDAAYWRAKVAMLQCEAEGRWSECYDPAISGAFAEVAARYPEGDMAPKALYMAARRTRKGEELLGYLQQLLVGWPDATITDDAILNNRWRGSEAEWKGLHGTLARSAPQPRTEAGRARIDVCLGHIARRAGDDLAAVTAFRSALERADTADVTLDAYYGAVQMLAATGLDTTAGALIAQFRARHPEQTGPYGRMLDRWSYTSLHRNPGEPWWNKCTPAALPAAEAYWKHSRAQASSDSRAALRYLGCSYQLGRLSAQQVAAEIAPRTFWWFDDDLVDIAHALGKPGDAALFQATLEEVRKR